MREEHRPRVADPLVEMKLTVGRLRREVGRGVVDRQRHSSSFRGRAPHFGRARIPSRSSHLFSETRERAWGFHCSTRPHCRTSEGAVAGATRDRLTARRGGSRPLPTASRRRRRPTRRRRRRGAGLRSANSQRRWIAWCRSRSATASNCSDADSRARRLGCGGSSGMLGPPLPTHRRAPERSHPPTGGYSGRLPWCRRGHLSTCPIVRMRGARGEGHH